MSTVTRLATKTPSKSSTSQTIPLNATSESSASKGASTEATLRSLYNGAARSFIQRELALTENLMNSAFALLPPPASSAEDVLSPHRKKWDILRVTLETTAYIPEHDTTLPPGLRANLSQSSHSLLTSMYTRSAELFTPLSPSQEPSSAFLPSTVLVTLVLSSLKLNAPEVGRVFVEDWLTRRGQVEEMLDDQKGYEKVLDIYCTEVLPRLDQWDHAKEFLRYENQMDSDKAERLIAHLDTLHTEHLVSQRVPPPTPPPKIPVPSPTPPPIVRPPSPASSTSSSSLSTTSTHTVIPRTPRPTHSRSRSASSTTSIATVLANPATKSRHHPTANGSACGYSPAQQHHPLPARVSHFDSPSPSSLVNRARQGAPSLLTIARSSLGRYLTASRLTTAFILFVVIPLLSILLRLRRRRSLLGAASADGGSMAVSVKRRLQSAEGTGLVGRIWTEAVRAVVDTVKMGGSGLV